MEITNSFTVDEPIEKAWELLTDIPFIAPCLPGAKLTGEANGIYSGGIKIKVGPVTTEYKGTAEFVEKDDQTYKAVINGKGRDTRGAGNAQALITAQMVPVGTTTQVEILTDLKVSGKVAQFGRGVMQDVSTKLLGQFADCLETKIQETKLVGGSGAVAGGPVTAITPPGGPTQTAPAPPAPPVDAVPTSNAAAPLSNNAAPKAVPITSGVDDDDVLDLGDIGVGSALAKRAAPVVGVLGLVFVLRWLLRRFRSTASE